MEPWQLLFWPFLLAQAVQDVPRSPVVLIRQTGPSEVVAQAFPASAEQQPFGGFSSPFDSPLFPQQSSQPQFFQQQSEPPQQQSFAPVYQQPLQFYQPPQQIYLQPQQIAVQPIFGPARVAAPPPPAVTGCVNPIPVPPPDSSRCKWYPIYDSFACVVDYECGEPDCPNSPIRPDSSTNCDWLEIKDRSGCIVDWECQPLNAAGCPGAPPKPEAPGKCRWTPVKSEQGCVYNWFCTPILPGPPPFGAFNAGPPPPPRQGDNHAFCCYWASIGDCDRNPIYMRTECSKSCGTPQCQVEEAETCKVHLNLVGCSLPNPRVPAPVPFFPPPPPPRALSPLPLPLNAPLGIPPLPLNSLGPLRGPNPFLPKPGPFNSGPFFGSFNRPFSGGPFGAGFGGPFQPKPLGGPFHPKPIGNFESFFNGPSAFDVLFNGPKPLFPQGGPFGGFGGPLPALNGPTLFDSPLPFGGPRTPFPFGGPQIRFCVNKSPGCQIWSLLGHCKSRTRFMLETCPKSCGACGFLKKKKKKK